MQGSRFAALSLKLRRIAAGRRQIDVAMQTGLSVTRYAEIEQGLRKATEFEQRLIEAELPSLDAALEEAREAESLS